MTTRAFVWARKLLTMALLLAIAVSALPPANGGAGVARAEDPVHPAARFEPVAGRAGAHAQSDVPLRRLNAAADGDLRLSQAGDADNPLGVSGGIRRAEKQHIVLFNTDAAGNQQQFYYRASDANLSRFSMKNVACQTVAPTNACLRPAVPYWNSAFAVAAADPDGSGTTQLIVANKTEAALAGAQFCGILYGFAFGQDENVAQRSGPGGCHQGNDYGVDFWDNLRVAAGDLDGDGKDEVVKAWMLLGRNEIALEAYDPRDNYNGWGIFARPSTGEGSCYIRVGCAQPFDLTVADLDGDGHAEIIFAHSEFGSWDPRVTVRVYKMQRTGPGVTFSEVAHTQLVVDPDNANVRWDWRLAGTIRLAAGDFNGDGRKEVAVTWTSTARRSLQVVWLEGGRLQAGNNVAVETWHWTRSGDVDLWWRGQAVAAGDVDADGKDEIVVAGGSTGNRTDTEPLEVAIYRASDLRSPTRLKADTSQTITSVGPGGANKAQVVEVRVGDLNFDGRAEVVVAWQPDYSHVNLASWRLTPQGDFEKLGWNPGPLTTAEPRRWGLAVANLFGEHFLVGPPTYAKLRNVEQVLAVVEAPPKHRDVIDGQDVDLNRSQDGTYAAFEDSNRRTTSMGWSERIAWKLSGGIDVSAENEKGPGGYIDFKARVFGGQSTEWGETDTNSLRISRGDKALTDDRLLVIESDFDVYEYPLYDRAGTRVIDHLAIVIPRGQSQSGMWGSQALGAYDPDHEPGNVLSYPQRSPYDDFRNEIDRLGQCRPQDSASDRETCRNLKAQVVQAYPDFGTWIHDMGSETIGTGGETDRTLSWSDVQDQDSKQSSDIGFSLDISGGFHYGGGADVKVGAAFGAEYDKESLSTYRLSLEKETMIQAVYGPLDTAAKSYTVDPYAYWAGNGYLVAKSAVDAEMGQWWWDHYQKPNLTFNRPFRWDAGLTDSLRARARGITVQRSAGSGAPQPGDTVRVNARVHNYSLTATRPATVEFWIVKWPCTSSVSRCDPAHVHASFNPDQRPTGTDLVHYASVAIPAIPARGMHAASIDWTVPAGNGVYSIWVMADRANEVAETNDGDNLGYGVLGVGSVGEQIDLASTDGDVLQLAQARQRFLASGAETDVHVADEHISLSPEEPRPGERVTVEVSVGATGEDFTHVDVSLFDGHPRLGGELVDRREVPLIEAGERSTIDLRWDTTGRCGTRDLWIRVEFDHGRELTHENNLARRVVHLEPCDTREHLAVVPGTARETGQIGLLDGFHVRNLDAQRSATVRVAYYTSDGAFYRQQTIGVAPLQIVDLAGRRIAVQPGEPVAWMVVEADAPVVTWAARVDSEAPAGNVMTVGPGQSFTISLPANASTGYEWRLAETRDRALVQVTGHHYLAPHAPVGLVGAPGVDRWNLRATARPQGSEAREAMLKFVYVRPWEPGAPPAREEVWRIHIR